MDELGRQWAGRPSRRAPRLGPDERIAPHLTRAGRFAKVDPLRARPRPPLPRILGTVGWAVLTVESLRRARARARPDPEDRA